MIEAAGLEYLVDAYRCDPAALRSRVVLAQVIVRLVEDLGLTPVAQPLWHVFPEPGGITGLCLLTESHITIHTFPEAGLATINLYCCRPRPTWAWEIYLTDMLGARQVDVRTVTRGERLSAPVSRRPRRSNSHDVATVKKLRRPRPTAR